MTTVGVAVGFGVGVASNLGVQLPQVETRSNRLTPGTLLFSPGGS